ncbi:type II toxin-antitoxin system RelE/ParE family toxin [bacterium]|nr:type II toxin-antitoxin system mRNA interferase toxin, RelE/StbE family [Candidatus Omnitrophota bacterium]MBU2529158.1 type II toxin-antitoxin system RelE/ParE family toxin [bacterium]MBU3930572.1 type II toxin-antitoxin system RelE/ParE family toxin [bacterium]MBU4123068.1 type II toxin-antitoxin system RelE/ParE family toxin [bacterium]
MTSYKIRFTKEAVKDVKKLTPRLKQKLKTLLLDEVAASPYSGKKLIGDLEGFYSLRLTYKDRIIYSVDSKSRTVFIHKTRTHYGD